MSDRIVKIADATRNLEAERSMLASCIMSPRWVDSIVDFLQPQDISIDAHQILWKAIVDRHERGEGIDSQLLIEDLRKSGQYEAVGGYDFLVDIIASVPTSANAIYYARIVHEKAAGRLLNDAAVEIIEATTSNQYTAPELTEMAEQKILAIGERHVLSSTVSVGQLVVDAAQRFASREEGLATGIMSGYSDLDDMLGGFRNGQLIIIAARPSMGKTAFALSLALQLSLGGLHVLKVSLEMGREELIDRLICMIARVDSKLFQVPSKRRNGKLEHRLGDHDRNRLGVAYGKLEGLPLTIEDAAPRNMSQIAATARRLKRKVESLVLIVDYLQLIDPSSKRGNRQEEVSEISRRLKMTAKSLSVPVVALSQINRQNENREDKRPRMSDLRESGSIENDADVILLLHRPEYYDPNDQPGVAEILIAKNRNGPTGMFRMVFEKAYTSFSSYAQDESQYQRDDGPSFEPRPETPY